MRRSSEQFFLQSIVSSLATGRSKSPLATGRSKSPAHFQDDFAQRFPTTPSSYRSNSAGERLGGGAGSTSPPHVHGHWNGTPSPRSWSTERAAEKRSSSFPVERNSISPLDARDRLNERSRASVSDNSKQQWSSARPQQGALHKGRDRLITTDYINAGQTLNPVLCCLILLHVLFRAKS
jgi:hypothetical protein